MKNYILYNDDVIEYIATNKDAIAEQLQININDVIFCDESCKAANNLIEDDYFAFIDLLSCFDNQTKYSYIFVDGDLGLWYGRKHATKNFRSLRDAICFCFEDVNKVFCKKNNTTITLQACHHDGCNNFKFYKVINGKKYAIKYIDLITLL